MNEILQVEEFKTLEITLFEKIVNLMYLRYQEIFKPLPPYPKEKIRKMLSSPGYVEEKSYYWFKLNNGTPVAYCHLLHMLKGDNMKLFWIKAYTHPEHRRKGHFKELLKETVPKIPEYAKTLMVRTFSTKNSDENSKKNLTENSTETAYVYYTDFERYLLSQGYKMTITDRSSGADLTEFRIQDIKQKVTELKGLAEQKGFKFVFVENYRFEEQPEIDYQDYLKALESIWNDMPRDEASWEDETLTKEKHQEFFKLGSLIGTFPWTFVALHVKTGNVAGITETWLDKFQPEIAEQDDTGVIREFRGNRLGLTLKYLMLEKLLTDPRSSEVKFWVTNNAFSNSHMLAINDELKYRFLQRINTFEMHKSGFVSYLGQS